MGFYWSNDPTNSVKALKEDRAQGLGFNPPGPPHRVIGPSNTTHMQYDKINTKKTQNTHESMHSEIGPVRQNPIQRTIRTAHLSVLWLCTTSVHNTAQNSYDNVSSYHQTTIIAHLLSIRGEGVDIVETKKNTWNVHVVCILLIVTYTCIEQCGPYKLISVKN